ncbi:hypothetical protein HYPSUDRAFT_504840 [Hypholoma sublateritium FD-334 SS-4]|uniref:Uncharacterized protein n=1 Tax=Hypholoma sublateritium (strain FD-334 SS-4) TaxID=945553 RepID=A0A0D2LMM3_HYPSF|nr:hypothetical protein HYPSUDRAFT_504840 [Hypholoma sublateritium FD-334 SS-4]
MASATATTLLPTSVTLSGEDAISAILSDIPLFCVGLMGIGVFTFLFMTKQVRIPLICLYGASFLAFVAATLDLSQVLIRRQQSTTVTLGTIAGFITAREVFLSLSVFFLDLFFWYLVAHCPRGELIGNTNGLSTKKSRARPSMHSASWNRWGIVGLVLKYGSLAALLSVPLLSLVWRLMPTQRAYSSTYIAQSIIQTTIMGIFLLKLLLNVSISPQTHWWRALLGYTIPIISLLIGISLAVGDTVLFSFTETALGRFLQAVEVYLLIVRSLFNAYYDNRQRSASDNIVPLNDAPLETQKLQYIASELPVAYSTDGYASSPRRTGNNDRVSTLSWLIPMRRESAAIQTEPRQTRKDEIEVLPRNVATFPPPSPKDSIQDDKISFGTDQGSRRPVDLENAIPERSSQTYGRPSTGVSLSYYAIDPSNLSVYGDSARTFNPKEHPPYLSNEESQRENLDADVRSPSTRGLSINSSQVGSVTSIDEIIRQQNELDQTIVALRLVSMSMSVQPDAVKSSKSTPDQSRSTLVSSKTESFSNRSDFSLSVFPNPPVVPIDDVATKYEETRLANKQRRKTRNFSAESLEQTPESPIRSATPTKLVQPNSQMGSALVTSYDVTSFIGEMSRPTEISRSIPAPTDDPTVETYFEKNPTISSAQPRPMNGLRPMILSSVMVTTPSISISNATSPLYEEEQRIPLNSIPEPVSLRPLLLGNTFAQSPPPRRFAKRIPLAQRRQRGGTISSDTRRPVISVPRVNRDRNEGNSEAFERPRPPPLVLNQ